MKLLKFSGLNGEKDFQTTNYKVKSVWSPKGKRYMAETYKGKKKYCTFVSEKFYKNNKK